jgi:phosphoribosyl 1,2-cyclic phosphodiesterase
MDRIRHDPSDRRPMSIRILGAHSYESGSNKCVSFLIDEVIAVDAGALASALCLPDLQKLKAVLLTHQHYDHVKDIPTLAISLFNQGRNIDVYCTSDVRDSIITHLLNGAVYPKFHELPEYRPTISFRLIEPYVPQVIEGYRVLALPVLHPGNTVGLQVSDRYNHSVFYTADTGPGLSACWERISPQLIIAETTLPNDHEQFALKTGHLTPNHLEGELGHFRRMKGYLPPVIVTHTDPASEDKIREEIAHISFSPPTRIEVAREGMDIAVRPCDHPPAEFTGLSRSAGRRQSAIQLMIPASQVPQRMKEAE